MSSATIQTVWFPESPTRDALCEISLDGMTFLELGNEVQGIKLDNAEDVVEESML